MLYVSAYDSKSGRYSVMDTEDGVAELVTKEGLLYYTEVLSIKIDGVSPKGIVPVSFENVVFDGVEKYVDNFVRSWTEEGCEEIARSGGFLRKIKGLCGDDLYRAMRENIYPSSISEVVRDACKFSNEVCSVDIGSKEDVVNALLGNVCLVLQQKSGGVLTAFVCTGGVGVVDSVYLPGFFDEVYLTKQLYNLTYNADRVRPRRENKPERNPSNLNVFSCSLRFRNDGKYHDKLNKVLSSPFYTLNLDRLIRMYTLKNPVSIGNTVLGETRTGEYDFDFNLYTSVKKALKSGSNVFNSKRRFMSLIPDGVIPSVPVEELMERFDNDWHYMQHLRQTGRSFTVMEEL